MEEPFEANGVYGVLHRPNRENGHGLALTHGAGSNSEAPLLVGLARAFEQTGYVVLRYDLPFRRQRRKGPPFPGAAARDQQGVALAKMLAKAAQLAQTHRLHEAVGEVFGSDENDAPPRVALAQPGVDAFQ